MSDFVLRLSEIETEELQKTGYVITHENYCVTLNSDGEYDLFKKVKGVWSLELDYGVANNDK